MGQTGRKRKKILVSLYYQFAAICPRDKVPRLLTTLSKNAAADRRPDVANASEVANTPGCNAPGCNTRATSGALACRRNGLHRHHRCRELREYDAKGQGSKRQQGHDKHGWDRRAVPMAVHGSHAGSHGVTLNTGLRARHCFMSCVPLRPPDALVSPCIVGSLWASTAILVAAGPCSPCVSS